MGRGLDGKLLCAGKIKLHLINGDKDLPLIIPMRAGGAGTSLAAAPSSPLMKK